MFEFEHAINRRQSEQSADNPQMLKFALWKYHHSLDLGENGDVAAGTLAKDLEIILRTPWERGKTLNTSNQKRGMTNLKWTVPEYHQGNDLRCDLRCGDKIISGNWGTDFKNELYKIAKAHNEALNLNTVAITTTLH